VLEGARLLHGGEPLLGDFHIAFWVMAALTVISALIFLRVPRTATMHSHQAEGSAAE
jgi:hypothetical protein